MMTPIYELYSDGEPTGLLFLSEANALHWVRTHGAAGAQYETRPFSPW